MVTVLTINTLILRINTTHTDIEEVSPKVEIITIRVCEVDGGVADNRNVCTPVCKVVL